MKEGKITRLVVSIEDQSLIAFNTKGSVVKKYSIASAKNGVGQQAGSECTPLGEHRVRAKIGADHVENTVFVGRRPTGEVYSSELASKFPQRDWILTRIMWLCGNERGINRGGSLDTQRRYIYIHGAPDSHDMGAPSSHGCIKMRNSDIVDLFSDVSVGTTVYIQNARL